MFRKRVLAAAGTLLVCLAPGHPARAAAGRPQTEMLSASEAQVMVQRALATEVRLAHDPGHPMRFRLRKQSPRLTTLKEIVETRDGAVARLLEVNGRPLDPAGEQQEMERLDALEREPGLQQHRKHGEDQDLAMVMKILRMMPAAFLYQYEGPGQGPTGTIQKFNFHPNPHFQPPDMETQALTAMSGELWLDAGQERVVRLAGRLGQDTNYGWGILGKLNKGGWLLLEQAEVAPHLWRIRHVQLQMTLRIVVKTKIFDTDEMMSDYLPVAAGIDYHSAIHLLRGH